MSDLEAWKKALLTLPGDRFLVLVRNYLGELRTPYNKQDLIRQLAAYLSERQTQERIVALVDAREAEVITALLLLGEASLDGLAALFAGRLGLLALGEMLANLEERLLVYRDHGGARGIRVNPVLEPVLRSEVFDSSRLFPWSPAAVPTARPVLWVADAALLALLSQLCAGAIPFKKDGGLRKRDLAALAAIFPAAASREEDLEAALAVMLRLLRDQDLLGDDGRPLVAAWRRFARRPRPVRIHGLLAPLLGPADVGGGRRDVAAHVVAGLVTALSARDGGSVRAFEPAGVQALCVALALRAAPDTVAGAPALVAALRDLNVLVPSGTGLALHPLLIGDPAAAVAVVQPNFEVTLAHEVLLEHALEVALAAEARQVDAVAVFEITRAAFQRYLDLGGTADRLIEALEELLAQAGRAAAPLPQNVVFSLRTWEREYRRLALYEGVVLVADEEHQYLLDNSPALRRHVRRKIAPGVYLLAASDREEWSAALRRAGVDHVPEIVAVHSESGAEEPATELPFEEPLLAADLSVPLGAPARARPQEQPRAAAAFKEALLSELAGLGLSEEDAAEIRDRIERGLILASRQLRPLASEKAEARGLDYLGKVRLIERAIERGALVEVLEREVTGAPRKILARPRKLEKSASGLFLVAEALPDGGDLRISVSRLSRVRLVLRSLLD